MAAVAAWWAITQGWRPGERTSLIGRQSLSCVARDRAAARIARCRARRSPVRRRLDRRPRVLGLVGLSRGKGPGMRLLQRQAGRRGGAAALLQGLGTRRTDPRARGEPDASGAPIQVDRSPSVPGRWTVQDLRHEGTCQPHERRRLRACQRLPTLRIHFVDVGAEHLVGSRLNAESPEQFGDE